MINFIKKTSSVRAWTALSLSLFALVGVIHCHHQTHERDDLERGTLEALEISAAHHKEIKIHFVNMPSLNKRQGKRRGKTKRRGRGRVEATRRSTSRRRASSKIPCRGRGCPDIKWIKIPGGSFLMGSTTGDSDERPVHQVRVKRFWMANSEVTVDQYRACVKAGVCTEPGRGSGCTWGRRGFGSHPVNCVDWAQARTFSRWVGGDLPTEAQWEYAALGGRNDLYAGSDHADSVAWYSGNTQSPRPVRSKRPNGYQLYDMSGNVWEWTLDNWHDSYRGAPRNAETPWGQVPSCNVRCGHGSGRRVNRGGSWANALRLLRSKLRDRDNPDTKTKLVGFRPVRMRAR